MIRPVTIERVTDSHFSDLFGRKNKAKRQEKRAARRQKRSEKKVEKARVKGAKERAQMGLDMPAPTPTQGPKNRTPIFFAIGAALAILAAVIYMVKR